MKTTSHDQRVHPTASIVRDGPTSTFKSHSNSCQSPKNQRKQRFDQPKQQSNQRKQRFDQPKQ